MIGLGAAGVMGVNTILKRFDRGEPEKSQRCTANVDGTNWYLSPDQAQNAALFAAMARDRGLPARAVTISIATALQESRMVNIDYGDRDSVGLFQQRPSQGWGSVEEIMDPVYATGKFFDGLVRVRNYTTLPVTEAAQAVQRSGFPDAYAQHENRARAWASALTGHSPASITCQFRDGARPADSAAPTARLAARIVRDLPTLKTSSEDDAPAPLLRLSASSMLPKEASATELERTSWSLAHWAVSVALEQDITEVSVGDYRWTRATGAWSVADTDGPAKGAQVAAGPAPNQKTTPKKGDVSITLAPPAPPAS